jgi:hypothetical protein
MARGRAGERCRRFTSFLVAGLVRAALPPRALTARVRNWFSFLIARERKVRRFRQRFFVFVARLLSAACGLRPAARALRASSQAGEISLPAIGE